MISFGILTGYQRAILATVLSELFPENVSDLNRFMLARNWGPLANRANVHQRFVLTCSGLVEDLYARGDLAPFFDDIVQFSARSPILVDLDKKLAVLGPQQSEQPVVAELAGLEAVVSKMGFEDPLEWAKRVIGLSRSICKITIQGPRGTTHGTGVLISDDQVLTAFHVIEPVFLGDADFTAVTCTFGYARGAEGADKMRAVKLATDWKGPHSRYRSDETPNPKSNVGEGLDFAVLRLTGKLSDLNAVSIDGPGQSEQSVVAVLQHPSGGVQKLSFGRTIATQVPGRLRYDANTEPGSSGGLVLSTNLEPVALHHYGSREAGYNQGVLLSEISSLV